MINKLTDFVFHLVFLLVHGVSAWPGSSLQAMVLAAGIFLIGFE